MPSTFKNASLNPINVGLDVLYTVPALTNAVAMSAIAANLSGESRSASIGIAPAGSSTINWLASNINVATLSSVNLLAAKVSLSAGDRLVANQPNAGVSNWHVAPSINCFDPVEPLILLSNPTGSIVVAASSSAIRTSLDGCKTSIGVTGNPGGNPSGMYFLGEFWIYSGAANALRSTDGITWTSFTAPANAPNSAANSTINGGLIIKDGAAFGRRQSGGQITTTTNGTVWTLVGVAPPTDYPAWCWTGIHFVVGATTAGTVHRSTNGAVWTSITIAGATSTVNTKGLAAIGQYVVAAWGDSQIYSSADHGATWAGSSGIAGSSWPVTSTGSVFWFASSGFVGRISSTGMPGTWSLAINDSFSKSNSWAAYAIANDRLISARSASFDLALTRRGGLTVTASVVEVS